MDIAFNVVTLVQENTTADDTIIACFYTSFTLTLESKLVIFFASAHQQNLKLPRLLPLTPHANGQEVDPDSNHKIASSLSILGRVRALLLGGRRLDCTERLTLEVPRHTGPPAPKVGFRLTLI